MFLSPVLSYSRLALILVEEVTSRFRDTLLPALVRRLGKQPWVEGGCSDVQEAEKATWLLENTQRGDKKGNNSPMETQGIKTSSSLMFSVLYALFSDTRHYVTGCWLGIKYGPDLGLGTPSLKSLVEGYGRNLLARSPPCSPPAFTFSC